jgi:MOSC domain-containing protein YiiM
VRLLIAVPTQLLMIQIRHLFIASGHSFFGRYGKGALDFPVVEVPRVHCLAGRGLEGDRFLDYKPDYKGQVTFFEYEQYVRLCRLFAVHDRGPGVFRRNVITQGEDLNSLIGEEFEVQGVRFRGSSECTPCEWMDTAFHTGSEEALRGVGGLRAKILSDGWLASAAPTEA